MDRRKRITINGKCRKTRLYNIWSLMKFRCNNPNSKDYISYGDRGVSVCDAWDNFDNFYTWAKSNGYRGNLTLDRINVDGNYEPINCRWATPRMQANNRTTSRLVIYLGEERTVAHWARTVGLIRNTLYKRLFEYGWPVEYAMTAPKYSAGPPDAKPKEKRKPVTPDKYGL